LREAGFQPNEFNAARTDEDLLNNLAVLVRELGRFPVMGEIKLKSRSDPKFPSHNTFRRFDGKGRSLRVWNGSAGTEARMISRNYVLWRPRLTMPKMQDK
jgi:hypothetical protein